MALPNELAPGLGIHGAARKCDTDAVRKYLRNGNDINAKDKHGMTPLSWALKAPLTSDLPQAMIDSLLANGANVNTVDRYGFTPMHLAAIGGSKEIVEALIVKGAKIDTSGLKGKSPLHLAVEKDHISVVELLIANGATINARVGIQGLTPLYYVKSSEMLELLKKNGATVRMYSWAEAIHFVFALCERLVSSGIAG